MVSVLKDEKCAKCKHCKKLYIPPTLKRKAWYGHCCTVFANDPDSFQVMVLDCNEGMCEMFSGKENRDGQSNIDT